MQWVLENWVWVLFGVGMIAMHLFGHGGHGGPSESRNGAPKTKPESQPGALSTKRSGPKVRDHAGESSFEERP